MDVTVGTIIACLCCLSSISVGQETGCEPFAFASYFSSSMVLQRGPGRALVWGNATSVNDEISVVFDGETTVLNAIMGPDGVPQWGIFLKAPTNPGPFVISATSLGCTIELTDVLFGDVFVCSGQSNMVFRVDEMDNPEPEIQDAPNYPNVRLFKAALLTSDTEQGDLLGISQDWTPPTEEIVAAFSAVCWLYGRNITTKFGVPVGLVQSAWGGTRIEAWSSQDAIDQCYPGGQAPDGGGANGQSVLWNAMMYPFTRMTITGALFYQGEANDNDPATYNCSLPAMVSDWRAKWSLNNRQTDPVFPFGNVQLAPNRNGYFPTGFTGIRWAQMSGLGYTPNSALPRVYTAVAMDLPDFNSPSGSIHPRYKRQIADRLLYGAYQNVYGVQDEGPYQGPLPTSVTPAADSITVEFDGGNANIEVRSRDGYEICCAAAADDPCEQASAQWRAASITQASQSALTLANPCSGAESVLVALRYAWNESPCALETCAVYGVENELPAPPFYTEI